MRTVTSAAGDHLVPQPIEPIAHTVTDEGEVPSIIDQAAAEGYPGYAAESDESCVGVRCFGVSLPFSRALSSTG